MTQKLQIAIIFGGRSGEHEVSLVSASSIISGLDKNKYDIIPIGITKEGQWISGPNALDMLRQNQMSDQAFVFLPPDPSIKHLVPYQQGASIDHAFLDCLKRLDVIFPILHGPYGEDGTIQGLFELIDIPYVGSGVLGSALCMDKIMQKQICCFANLPSVEYVWFRDLDWFGQYQGNTNPTVFPNQLTGSTQTLLINKIVEKLDFPVFVKPPNMGSSVGITKAHNISELKNGIQCALEYDRKVLIEKSVENAREIEVSILGNEIPEASVAGEVTPSSEFYDYNAKYIDGCSDLTIPANLSSEIHNQIRKTAIQAVQAAEVSGFSRVDFLLDPKTNNFYLSEINTLPGFTKISMFPKLWEATGLSYAALLDKLVALAFEKHHKKMNLKTSYQPKKEWFK